jgi:hypothetical protein
MSNTCQRSKSHMCRSSMGLNIKGPFPEFWKTNRVFCFLGQIMLAIHNLQRKITIIFNIYERLPSCNNFLLHQILFYVICSSKKYQERFFFSNVLWIIDWIPYFLLYIVGSPRTSIQQKRTKQFLTLTKTELF